jgi:uncharacterized damage-inducible protein DinB
MSALLEPYRALARYNAWMNDKLYAAAAQLSDAERKRDLGAFFKSIHGTLNHLLLADYVWLGRLTGDASCVPHAADGSPIAIRALSQELYADFEPLRAERTRLDARLLAWVSQLTEAQALAELSYASLGGAHQSHPLWHALSQLFNHQTHHRGQLTTLLMQQGIDPGVTDLIAMLRQEPR